MSEPNILSLGVLADALHSNPTYGEGTAFYRDDGLVVVNGMDRVMRSFMRPQSPYLIDDYRCAVVLRGSLRGCINLMEYNVTAGTLVYISPGSFVEPLEVSDDFQINGIGMTAEVYQTVCRLSVPGIFSGRVKDGRLALSEEEVGLTETLFRTYWRLLRAPSTSRDTRISMAAALLGHISDLFARQEEAAPAARNAAADIFDRFVQLVGSHARRERRLAFYADKMCISDRYLGAVVSRVSGVTAKEWIDRAVVTHAKVLLRHDRMTIAQIADELSFANPSFFCKYFRRLVGCTPQEYRAGLCRDGDR